jgi:putative acetyltransferase
VAPTTQRQGIGRSLIEAGLTQARQLGWEVVFVLGDPAYYSRFGFRVDLAQGFSCAYAGSHFMALPLGAHLPIGKGHIEYAPAFSRISSEPI